MTDSISMQVPRMRNLRMKLCASGQGCSGYNGLLIERWSRSHLTRWRAGAERPLGTNRHSALISLNRVLCVTPTDLDAALGKSYAAACTMIGIRAKNRRKLLLPLLFIGSTLVWFCLLRLPRRSSLENTNTEPSTRFETPNSKIYENTSFSPVRADVLDIQDSANSLDVSTFTDHHLPAIEIEGSITVAVLPVDRDSLATLSATLATFLPLSLSIQELALLCPAEVAPAVRDVLREVFTDEDEYHFDVSTVIWQIGLDEGSAILRAARQVSADRLILFDSSSLGDITYGTLAMLSSPLLTPLPVGPKGFNISEDGISCIVADENPKAAAFLVPPFSVAPTLVPTHDLVPTPVYDVWQALGEHISRARFEHVGGVVVSRDPSAPAWCPGSDVQASSPCETSTAQCPASAVEASRRSPASDATRPDRDTCHDTAPSLIVVFGSETSFHRFSPAICRMKNQGHALAFFLVTHTDAAQETTLLEVPLSLCTIEVAPRHPDSLAAQIQISLATCSPTTIVISGLAPVVSDAVLRVVSENHASTTLVRIPDQDLPYCDWFSLLSTDAWRSEFPERPTGSLMLTTATRLGQAPTRDQCNHRRQAHLARSPARFALGRALFRRLCHASYQYRADCRSADVAADRRISLAPWPCVPAPSNHPWRPAPRSRGVLVSAIERFVRPHSGGRR